MTEGDEKVEEQGAGRTDSEHKQVDEINGDINMQTTENDTRNEEERQMLRDKLEIMRSGQVSNGACSKELTGKCW